jgi:hypothetical protein
MRFEKLTPMLQTRALARTIEWYESLLGFRCVDRAGDVWCRLVRDGAELMFMVNDHLGEPAATATQYVRVDDVMALWTSIRARVRAEWGPERPRTAPNGWTTGSSSSRSRTRTATC